MTKLFGMLSLALVLAVSVQAQEKTSPPSSPPPLSDAERTCGAHLKILTTALLAYKAAHGAFPTKLSDLYPEQVKDKAVFHCPADKTSGDPLYPQAARDADFPTSYVYEWSHAEAPAGGAGFQLGHDPLPPHATWKDAKQAQARHFGGRVPLLTCWHHTEGSDGPTALIQGALSGKVYTFWPPEWEYSAEARASVISALSKDAGATPPDLSAWSFPKLRIYTLYATNLLPNGRVNLPDWGDSKTLLAISQGIEKALPHLKEDDRGPANSVAGYFARAAGDAQAALRLLEKAFKLAPEGNDKEQAAFLFAEALWEAKKNNRAIKLLTDRMKTNPDHYLCAVALVGLYEEAGEIDKAKTLVLKLQAAHPDHKGYQGLAAKFSPPSPSK